MEYGPWWKTTLYGRQALMEGGLWWKTIFDWRWPSMLDNILRGKQRFVKWRLSKQEFDTRPILVDITLRQTYTLLEYKLGNVDIFWHISLSKPQLNDITTQPQPQLFLGLIWKWLCAPTPPPTNNNSMEAFWRLRLYYPHINIMGSSTTTTSTTTICSSH